MIQNNNELTLTHSKGFSLVELSIVIVIIGFLIAGIAAGNNLIKQAQLRSVISDFQSYGTSYNNFLSKYNRVPGDMNTASLYWTGTTCAASAALCNGDNNGVIDYSSSSPTTNEVNKAWKHLALANMLSANISTVSAVVTGVGTQAPSSKISAAGYIMVGGATAAPFTTTTNAVFLGREKATETLLTAALTPEDAYGIDQKMDDGNVDAGGSFVGGITGAVRSKDGDGVTAGQCVASATGIYDITRTTATCRIGMALN